MFREEVVYRVADYPVMPMKKVKLYAPGGARGRNRNCKAPGDIEGGSQAKNRIVFGQKYRKQG